MAKPFQFLLLAIGAIALLVVGGEYMGTFGIAFPLCDSYGMRT
jgi:hypothetical protein